LPTMAGNEPQLYELHKSPYWKAVIRSAAQTAIGDELRALCEVPQDLPRGMFMLLMQLNQPREEE
jgi:hypothetical protein